MTTETKVCVIDYGLGNLFSVKHAISALDTQVVVSCQSADMNGATHLVLPGVGSFADGMRGLYELNLIDVLQEEVIKKQKPILGICLGMQLFATRGLEHGEHSGLGFIDGIVTRIDTSESHLRLPHVGWNTVSIQGEKQITQGFTKPPIFYFVHSYHLVADNPDEIVGYADYGVSITALIQSGNIFGAQFHPEKSHKDGEQIFKNFLSC